MAITHSTVVVTADDGTSEVGSDEWNAAHTITTDLSPGVNDGASLGVALTAWSDLFLASGSVINFNNGDVTITHSAGGDNITFAGGGGGYYFSAAVCPTPDDGAALGIAATAKWSDLFLASGAVINFNNGDVTLTHAADALTLAGGSLTTENLIIGSANSLAWSTDLFLVREAAATLAQRNSTNAQKLNIYTTFTDASNYERLELSGSGTGHVTLKAASAGTGNDNMSMRFVLDNPGFNGLFEFRNNTNTAASVSVDEFGGIVHVTGGTHRVTGLSLLSSGGSNARAILIDTGQFCWSSSSNEQLSPDTGLNRVAAGVVGIGAGVAGGNDRTGWYQWAGQARVSGDFSKTSDVTLANVTGLSVTVAAGRTYSFWAELPYTCAAAGGVQAAIAGTATATDIRYNGYIVDSAANGIKGNTQAAALATAVASAATTGTDGLIRIVGTITVNAGGTLTVQFAQNTSNGTASVVKRGAYFTVLNMP